ncbi:MFS transporter, partial [Citrobacter freundii]
YGHTGVFIALVLLALLLLMLTVTMLPETRPEHTLRPRLAALLSRMARDYELWKNAILVALLNTMLFSYYSLAPFLFGQLGWSSRAFGLTGLLLAFASLSGSLLNQRLLTTGLTPEQLVRYACALAALSGLVAWCLQHSAWILIPVFGVVIAYGIAIPNVLSQALRHYREQAGAAGALFGLSYYLLLGMMLGFAGMVQQLGLVLSVCALLAWLCSLGRR